MTTTSIVRTLTRGTTFVVRHPARTALNAVGLAKGTMAAGLGLVSGGVRPDGDELHVLDGEVRSYLPNTPWARLVFCVRNPHLTGIRAPNCDTRSARPD